MWADNLMGVALKAIAPDFQEATGVALEIVEKPFGDIRDQFKVAGPAGEGPDLFIGAHEWPGEPVRPGPVGEGGAGRF